MTSTVTLAIFRCVIQVDASLKDASVLETCFCPAYRSNMSNACLFLSMSYLKTQAKSECCSSCKDFIYY